MDIPSVLAEFRWNVFLVDLNPVVGSEQANTRPVIVVSNEAVNRVMPVVTVVPITSRKQERKIYPNEALLQKGAGGLERESIVLCHQIRTVDKQRLIKRIGVLEDRKDIEQIIEALCFQLEMVT